MISYRFKRRAFIAGMSGGVGLKIMLRNMEAVAQGTTRSPGRLLVQHWPVGIVAGSNNALFTATSGSTGGSQGLQPFTDAGLARRHDRDQGDLVAERLGRKPRRRDAGAHDRYGLPGNALGRGGARRRLRRWAVVRAGHARGRGHAAQGRRVGAQLRERRLRHADGLRRGLDQVHVLRDGQDNPYGALSGPGQENIPNMPNLSPLNLYNLMFQNFTAAAQLQRRRARPGRPPGRPDAHQPRVAPERPRLREDRDRHPPYDGAR